MTMPYMSCYYDSGRASRATMSRTYMPTWIQTWQSWGFRVDFNHEFRDMVATVSTEAGSANEVPGSIAIETALEYLGGSLFGYSRRYTDHDYYIRIGWCGYEKETT